MKTQVSALMDGELEGHELVETLRAVRRSPELRGAWCDGQLIGAALRGERGLAIDVTARVMAAIEMEPTLMAPAPKRVAEWRRPALALAASVAGVALVAWLALAPAGAEPPPPTGGLAAVRPAPAPTPATSPALRLQEYLLAHQAYAPSGAVVSGARNIRTVAARGEGG